MLGTNVPQIVQSVRGHAEVVLCLGEFSFGRGCKAICRFFDCAILRATEAETTLQLRENSLCCNALLLSLKESLLGIHIGVVRKACGVAAQRVPIARVLANVSVEKLRPLKADNGSAERMTLGIKTLAVLLAYAVYAVAVDMHSFASC